MPEVHQMWAQVGQTILVQEYMENGDLFRIALDTARGLFFLHSRK